MHKKGKKIPNKDNPKNVTNIITYNQTYSIYDYKKNRKLNEKKDQVKECTDWSFKAVLIKYELFCGISACHKLMIHKQLSNIYRFEIRAFHFSHILYPLQRLVKLANLCPIPNSMD